jgi:hypothetical protein
MKMIQKYVNLKKIGLICLVLFWTGVSYQFYAYFYQTGGRIPNWIYETHRPFFAGWSDVSSPVIQDDTIYFCAGYGWWDNEVSLSALKKDGTLIWKTLVQYRCNEMDIVHNKIYVGQNHYRIDHEKSISEKPRNGIVRGFRTLIVDSKNGEIIQTLPFEYSYISQNNIYSTDNNNIYIYNLLGTKIKNISLPSPSFIKPHYPKNSDTSVLLRTHDGFWKIDTRTNNAEHISDKGRSIFDYKSSDKYLCYTSYDAKYDIKEQNKNIDERISCRRQDNWKKAIEDIPTTSIDCLTFYMGNDPLFIQRNTCKNHEGYIAINLDTKEQLLIQSNSKKISRIGLGYNSTTHFFIELKNSREIIVKNRQSNQDIWTFKSIGNVRGFVEESDAVYIYDDEGKLYMFNK